jgi:hypothetical protein
MIKENYKEFYLLMQKLKQVLFLKALQTHEPQLKQQTSLLIPKINENSVLLFMFIMADPSELHSIALFSYNIYDTSKRSWFYSQPIIEKYLTSSQIVLLISQS